MGNVDGRGFDFLQLLHHLGESGRGIRFRGPFAVAHQFTGMEGKYVKLEETVSSFERLAQGEFDQYPEQAFIMCGGADDIVKNAERLAAQG